MRARIKRIIIYLKKFCVLDIKNEHLSFKHCYVFNEMSETTVGIKRSLGNNGEPTNRLETIWSEYP